MEKIDSICQLAFEKHATFRKQILKILLDVAELMDINELEHLFEKVSQVNIQEIDQDVLQIIKAIGKEVSTSKKKVNKLNKKLLIE